jgi:hypothetical protein
MLNFNFLPTFPSASIGTTVHTERRKTKRERARKNGTISSFYRVELPN